MRAWLGLGVCLLGMGCAHIPTESVAYLQKNTSPVGYEYAGYGIETNALPLGFQFRLFGSGILLVTPKAAKQLEETNGQIAKDLLSNIAVIKYDETRGWIAGSLARLPNGSAQTFQQLLFSNRWDALFPSMREWTESRKLPPWIQPRVAPPASVSTEGGEVVGFQSLTTTSARNQPASLWLIHHPGEIARTCLVVLSPQGLRSDAEEAQGMQQQCRSVQRETTPRLRMQTTSG